MEEKFTFLKKDYKFEQMLLIIMIFNFAYFLEILMFWGIDKTLNPLFFYKLGYVFLLIYGIYLRNLDYQYKFETVKIYLIVSIIVNAINCVFYIYLLIFIFIYFLMTQIWIIIIIILLIFIYCYFNILILKKNLHLRNFILHNPNFYISRFNGNEIN